LPPHCWRPHWESRSVLAQITALPALGTSLFRSMPFHLGGRGTYSTAAKSPGNERRNGHSNYAPWLIEQSVASSSNQRSHSAIKPL